jgi:hypothetical protein
MNETPIQKSSEWWCASQDANVEHRGAGMGKVYVYRPGTPTTDPNNIQAVYSWTAATKHRDVQIMPHGPGFPDRDVNTRAIRALALSPWGAVAFKDEDMSRRVQEIVDGKHVPEIDAVRLTAAVPRLFTSDELNDLQLRMSRAADTLLNMILVEPDRADHFRSKAEGVRLALSYLQEMRTQ